MKNAAGGKETQALLLSTLGLERHENVCGELHGKYLRGKEQTDFAIRWYTIKDSTKTSPRARWMFNHIQAALEPSGFTFAVSAWPP